MNLYGRFNCKFTGSHALDWALCCCDSDAVPFEFDTMGRTVLLGKIIIGHPVSWYVWDWPNSAVHDISTNWIAISSIVVAKYCSFLIPELLRFWRIIAWHSFNPRGAHTTMTVMQMRTTLSSACVMHGCRFMFVIMLALARCRYITHVVPVLILLSNDIVSSI